MIHQPTGCTSVHNTADRPVEVAERSEHAVADAPFGPGPTLEYAADGPLIHRHDHRTVDEPFVLDDVDQLVGQLVRTSTAMVAIAQNTISNHTRQANAVPSGVAHSTSSAYRGTVSAGTGVAVAPEWTSGINSA